MIWREKRVVLIILAILLLANTAFFFTYRVQYESRLKALDDRLQEAQDRLQRARNARIAAQQQIDGYHKVQTDLADVYNQRWATEPERLTALVVEIKKVTAASQLVPRSLSFSESSDGQKGTGTTAVAIHFAVQGTYQQVRRLINLLELSDQFVIIDAISLGGAGEKDQTLTLNIRLKTIFRNVSRPGFTPQAM